MLAVVLAVVLAAVVMVLVEVKVLTVKLLLLVMNVLCGRLFRMKILLELGVIADQFPRSVLYFAITTD